MANPRAKQCGAVAAVLAAIPVFGCQLVASPDESARPSSLASASAPIVPIQAPVFVVASVNHPSAEPSARVATADYALDGLGSLPVSCTDPAIVMMAVPKNYYASDSFDWRHVRQVALANPEFSIVRALSAGSNPKSIAFSENEHRPTQGVALVAHCKTSETCLKFAAAYRTVVPTAKFTPICGANPNIGSRITGGKSVLPVTGTIQDVLPDAKDAQSQCVRLAACKAARDHSLSSDETQTCMQKPSTFKLRCASKKSCEQVLACVEG